MSGTDIRFLEVRRPDLDAEEAAEVAARLFGVSGQAEPIYSERDRNFRLRSAGGEFILKIANAEEDPSVTDFQLGALLHIGRTDPGLPVPRVRPTLAGQAFEELTLRSGARHAAYMLSFIPGVIIGEVRQSPALLADHGRMVARLGRALRGHFHPAAGRGLLWDVRQIARFRPLLERVQDAALRGSCLSILDRFVAETAPALERLRAQVVHGDAGQHNVIVDPDMPERVAGIVDFGDIHHGPLVSDLVAAIADLQDGRIPIRELAPPIAAAYHAVTPLEPEELALLPDLILARHVGTVAICSWRQNSVASEPGYLDDTADRAGAFIDEIRSMGRSEFAELLRRACSGEWRSAGAAVPEPIEHLLGRRSKLLGPHLQLFYDPPLHLVRGQGPWLYDASGRRYLDAYNNVPHVGHCHPHVVEAVARQSATLNTNTRYLFGSVLDYAERLTRTLPPELSVCAFVNSGSEATDLAWRMAKAFTGHGGALIMEDAYHGITEAADALSPSGNPAGAMGAHVRALVAPDEYRGPYRRGAADLASRYAEFADAAIASLAEAGLKPAAFFIDSTFLTNGVLEPPEGYLARVFEKVRAAGGLCVADEVQAGFGRMGGVMWGFETHGVAPDIVTLGKPVGNGHPVGVVVTRPEILDAFARQTSFFSTFGGNCVSAAAALAVLDVIERERLPENAAMVGAHLKRGLQALMEKHPLIGDVRGRGLTLGVELVHDRAALTPAREETREVLNRMRDHGVLVGSEGRHGNILKIRPPIVIGRAEADLIVAALDAALTEIEG
ncbi:MAG TPA: aminotransferase class III-fold pyridoxal phosphate-dependent enzyme [Alphaproteobacteria bacterium]